MQNPFMDLPDAKPRGGGVQNPFMALPDLKPADPATPTSAQVNTEAKANGGGGALRYVDNLVRQGANALTFGFADELSAGASQATGIGPTASAPSYDAAIAQERARDKGFEQSNPVAATGAQIAGAMLAPAPGLAWAAKAPGIIAKAGRSAAVAAPMGALTGFGQGEGGVENRLEKAQSDGLLAAGIGAALPPVAIGAGKVVNAAKDALAPLTASGRERLARQQLAEGVTGAKIGADEFQPAVQKAIENIDAAQQAARQINEPLGQLEGYMAKIMGDNPGVWAGDRWIDPATGATIMKPYQPTTGVAIGTPNALGAEQQARLKSPDQFIERDAQNNEALTAYLRTLDSGDPTATRQALADVGDRSVANAAQAAEAARQVQAQAVADIRSSTGRSPEEIGTSNYEALRGKYQAARQKKNELYGAVPNEVVPGSASLRETAAGLQNAFEAAPSPVNALAAGQGDMTAQELMQVRREAVRTMRQFNFADPTKAQKAGEIAAAASKALNGEGSPESVRAALKAADDFYKAEILPNYRRDAGRDLATPGAGGQEARLAPSRGLSAWVKPDTQKGAEAADQLKRIAGEDPAVKQNVRDHFFNLAADKAVKGETVDPGAIRKMMKDYRAFLERFPEVRNDLARAANRAENAAKQGAVAKELSDGAAAYSKSMAGRIADADPSVMVDRLRSAPDPAAAVREVRAHLVSAGPEAESGLKQAVTDKIYSEISQNSRFTSATGQEMGERKLSPAAMEKIMEATSKWRPLLAEVYTPDQMRVLTNLHTELSRIQKLGNRASSGSDTAEKAGRILPKTIAAGMVNLLSLGAASSHGFLAGVGVQTAAALRQYTKGQIAEIVNRAMLDPDLAKVMLSKATEDNARKALKLFEKVANAAPRAGLAAAAMTD